MEYDLMLYVLEVEDANSLPEKLLTLLNVVTRTSPSMLAMAGMFLVLSYMLFPIGRSIYLYKEKTAVRRRSITKSHYRIDIKFVDKNKVGKWKELLLVKVLSAVLSLIVVVTVLICFAGRMPYALELIVSAVYSIVYGVILALPALMGCAVSFLLTGSCSTITGAGISTFLAAALFEGFMLGELLCRRIVPERSKMKIEVQDEDSFSEQSEQSEQSEDARTTINRPSI